MLYRRLITLAALLALIVIVLGAYTRLVDAGLGCPDWPGCYGQLTVPATEAEVEDKSYLEQRPLVPAQGWAEMIHRYFASALGLVIVMIAVMSWQRRKTEYGPLKLPLFLVVLVVFQGLLGMWTVTLLLKPVVVMSHLLGGLSILSLLVLLALRVGPAPSIPSGAQRLKSMAMFGLIIVVAQIALGGWTSTNYAALACPDFPTCNGSYWPEADFAEGFVMWRGLGINYEFGVLEHPARMAIHLAHRVGALVTVIYLAWLITKLLRMGGVMTASGFLIAGLLGMQVSLGIANVMLHLPLGIAVAHNAVAALLLLSLVQLNYKLWRPQY